MAAFHFELVSPEKLLFSGDVESVVAPGSEGQFTVLKDHAPLMTTLKPGVVTIVGDGASEKLFVRGGFADVNASGFTILAEEAVPVAELNATKLDADIKDAREDVEDAKTDEARRTANERLDQLQEVKAALGL